MTLQTLPAGRKLCPGWTSEFSPSTHVDRDGYASPYAALKASGSDVRYACGQARGRGGRVGDQSVIRDVDAMCSRCRRQKSKFDEENGARQKRAAEREAQHRSLVEAYAGDVKAAIPAGTKMADTREFLAAVVTALDGLAHRADRPPHPKRGDDGYYRFTHFGEVAPSEGHKTEVLRHLAGLPLRGPR